MVQARSSINPVFHFEIDLGSIISKDFDGENFDGRDAILVVDQHEYAAGTNGLPIAGEIPPHVELTGVGGQVVATFLVAQHLVVVTLIYGKRTISPPGIYGTRESCCIICQNKIAAGTGKGNRCPSLVG